VAADPSKASMPIGSGPFIVQSFAPRDNMVVVRNPNYWLKDSSGRQLPYLDKITFRVIADSEISGQALKSGDLDIFSTSDGTVINDFRKQADQFPMAEQDRDEETNFYLMDLTKPPFDDVRIRCALAMSIDRQEIIDATDGGVLTPANGVFSPGKEGYLADNGFDIAQDIEGAKALVDQYKADHPGDVTINFGTTTSATNTQRAELLKGYWEAIGLKFNYVEVPQDAFVANAVFGVPEFQIYGWRQYAGTTVDILNHWWNSRGSRPDGQISLNFPRLNDPQIDADLAVIRSTTDTSERVAKSEDINRIMAKQCYFIPESVTLWGTPHKPSLKGLGEMPLPDGPGTALDGAGFSGQFWTPTLWIDKNA
jgi:ABC-type transport system substrate-binding protein